VAYAFTPVALLLPLVLLLDWARPWQRFAIGRGWDEILELTDAMGYALVLLWAWATVRLAVAARMYLRIPHAVSTALLSQVMVFLGVITIGQSLIALYRRTGSIGVAWTALISLLMVAAIATLLYYWDRPARAVDPAPGQEA
jgi:hypothetical protein